MLFISIFADDVEVQREVARVEAHLAGLTWLAEESVKDVTEGLPAILAVEVVYSQLKDKAVALGGVRLE